MQGLFFRMRWRPYIALRRRRLESREGFKMSNLHQIATMLKQLSIGELKAIEDYALNLRYNLQQLELNKLKEVA